jgi:2-hydroxychromene-2-carboxylate isomerase
MTLRSRIKGAAIGAYVGAPGRRLRGAAAELARRVRRAPRAVDFFHDITDPWSHLTAQAVQRLAARYPVELRFHLVSAPASDVDAQPQQRLAHAVRDARELADHWDLSFPAAPKQMDTQSARWVASALIQPRPFADQLRAAIELGEAAWRGDHAAVQQRIGAWGHESHMAVPPVLASGYARLRDAGHYQGAMLAYGGEWFWGIDRIPHLEARLADDTGVPLGTGVLAARPAATRPAERLIAGAGPVPVEVWWSFRSPYSYLALDRLAALAATYPVELRWRPILPMVQRGIPAPSVKKMYIVHDAKREADRLGVPFGRVADPLGAGVDHCLAIARLAIDRGRALDFLQSAGRGIWSEALDVASYVDLRTIVERAGLDWSDARAALADDRWRAWATGNADDLAALGLWGVPSFRAGNYVTWGQDRVEFLADRLRRHVLAAAA